MKRGTNVDGEEGEEKGNDYRERKGETNDYPEISR